MSSPSFSEPPDGFVQAAQACRLLGISDRTLRRRVQAGTVEGEYIPRPQGTVLYVKLPPELEQAAGDAAPDTAPRKPAETAEETEETHAASLAAHTAMFLERLDTAQAALLAATERATRAEVERDAARETAARERDDVRSKLEAELRRTWWDRLRGR